MLRKILILLVIVLMLLTGCQYLKSDDENLITGEVIEIEPDEKISEENLEEDYSDILVRVEGIEGDLMELKPAAYDPDGDEILYLFTEPFDEKGEWQTEEGDAGKYLITVTASDGKLSTSEDVLITIHPTNKAPRIECPDKVAFKESNLVKLHCNIYDPEGEDLDIEYDGWMDSDEKETDYDDEGEYEVTITASDGKRTTKKTISILIENLNRLPVVDDVEDIKVEETDIVTLDLQATDADDDELTYKFSEPFDENGVWETGFGDAGTYESSVLISDGKGTVKKEFVVVVELKNTAPNVELIEPITVDEGETIELSINAWDGQGDVLAITISGFMDSDTYTTTFDDAGEHIVTISVSDGELTTSQDVEITVNDVNRPPVFRIPV